MASNTLRKNSDSAAMLDSIMKSAVCSSALATEAFESIRL